MNEQNILDRGERMSRAESVAARPYEVEYVREPWDSYCKLVRSSDGVIICTDAMEPEDVSFGRDLSPMVDELNRVGSINLALIEALEAADRVLYLLDDEVKQLGCNATKVPAMVKAALAAARGEQR
jgi:hypothetical protein